MKRKLLSGVLAVVMAAMVGLASTGVAAQQASQLWSVMIHFEYASGFSFDYVLAEGVTAREMTSILQWCGQSHQNKDVVRYYCYPVAE